VISFCDLLNNQDITDETPLHLFYECEWSSNLGLQFFSAITGGDVSTVSRHETFCCFSRFGDARDQLLTIAAKLLIFYLWECKMRQALGDFERLMGSLKAE
jgi:hypothetical protein